MFDVVMFEVIREVEVIFVKTEFVAVIFEAFTFVVLV